jgi:Domain of unknown function (DUF4349)
MRLRDEETLSPEAEHDLEALDAALAGKPVPENEALAQLAHELRAERPAPEPRFTEDLDARAAEGFRGASHPGPFARLRERLATTPPRRMLAPAGALATLAVVAGVALSQTGGDGEGEPAPTIVPAQGPGAAAEQAPADSESPESLTLPQPSPADDPALPPALRQRNGLAPGQENRKVERAAQITLSAESDEVPSVADGVIEVSDRYGGIVISSQVTESGGDTSVARIELAIPADELQDALADISALADVSARSEDMVDITQPFVSARERLSDARAELDSLLTQLAEADTPRETRSIRRRIDIVRSDIAAARAELENVSRRARFATVSVTVDGDGGDGQWSLGEAADDAVDVLRTTAGVALVSAAVLLPLALLGLIAWLVGRGAVRRRRERALD